MKPSRNVSSSSSYIHPVWVRLWSIRRTAKQWKRHSASRSPRSRRAHHGVRFGPTPRLAARLGDVIVTPDHGEIPADLVGNRSPGFRASAAALRRLGGRTRSISSVARRR